MPTIQQENGRSSVKGLPLRWGVRAYQELTAARAGRILGEMTERYKKLAKLLDAVINAPIPLECTDAQLCVQAERRATMCAAVTATIHAPEALRARLAGMVINCGLEPPKIADDRQFMLRCVDPAWWRRNLRRVHGRAFEHAAIRLGFVSIRAGAYASNETVAHRQAQNARNARTLAAVNMTNEHDHTFTLAELVARGIGNKAIRRGELMLRMAGCEIIANELGHVGVFVTLTAPSKYHAVLAKSGTVNPNYNGASPREAQAALMGVWKCIRAKLHRDGVRPYGFRIAEPHHDGCPHWHLLLFAPAEKVNRLRRTLHVYARREDGNEPGAAKNRIKIVRIQADKGTAAGYIAKYVAKNMDGEHIAEHRDADGNVIATDLVGDQVIKPSQRVEAWASCWGIRQFQGIGQPPVTIWRELRRIAAAQVAQAPAHVRAAWDACQRVTTTDAETGEVVVLRPASFADYIRAQGGVNQGRAYLIGLSERTEMREGRYGLDEREMPVGVHCKALPGVLYASTRYQWKRSGGVAAIRRPWSPVNNCTDYAPPPWDAIAPEPQEIMPHDDSEHWGSIDFEFMDHPDYQDFVLNPENGARVVAALATCERHERAFCFFEDI